MEEFGTQHEAPMTPPSSGAPGLVGQWSWAGFMFNWLYLVGHNVVGLGVGLLAIGIVVSIIPILNFISPLVWLGIALFVAIKGHEYAWSSGTFKTADEFTATQRVINTMGKVWFFIALVVAIIWALVMLIFGAAFMSMLGGAGGLGGALPSG